jgi:hypothetical protein
LRPKNAITDARGNVLIYAQTGGMLSPQKHEMTPGTTLFRFASSRGGGQGAMAGGWWVGAAEFERILRFARINNLSDPMAARVLCGVPPEWSDMGVLVKVRLRGSAGLLGWRGLANSVITPHPKGGPDVKMLHQNANSERRLHQLFIPGLSGTLASGGYGDTGLARQAFTFEGEWKFSANEASKGWLYL